MLNAEEQATTSSELRQYLLVSELTNDQVADDLGFDPARLARTLDVVEADPSDVWLVRDYLVQVLADQDRPQPGFTVLTDQARDKAAGWFELREAPRHQD